MDRFLEELETIEYCNIGNTYAFTSEDAYNILIDILEEEHLKHERDENSYMGIYMIKILED